MLPKCASWKCKCQQFVLSEKTPLNTTINIYCRVSSLGLILITIKVKQKIDLTEEEGGDEGQRSSVSHKGLGNTGAIDYLWDNNSKGNTIDTMIISSMYGAIPRVCLVHLSLSFL